MRDLQREIIDTLGVQPSINTGSEIERRSSYLADYLGASGLNGFVLGISGGQDSLLAGLVAKQAVEKINATHTNRVELHALLLPYGKQRDRDDAIEATQLVQPNSDFVHDINIKNATDAAAEAIGDVSDFEKGNIKARMRMIAHYAIAGKYRLLVIGTDHAAEAVTGFYTKHGDGGADILPLSGLTKQQGRELLIELGAPEKFIQKVPTADLLDNTPGQSDEVELGIRYNTIDAYLTGKTIGSADANWIEQQYSLTEHKRHTPASYNYRDTL